MDIIFTNNNPIQFEKLKIKKQKEPQEFLCY